VTAAAAALGRGRLAARPALGLIILAAAFLASAVLALGIGPVPLTPAQVLQALAASLGLAEADPAQLAIVTGLRLPRLVLAALVGSALALSGAIMQGLFRNPLADPSLLGISGGGTLGAVAVIVLGAAWLPLWLVPHAQPLVAFLGALAAGLTIQRIATRDGRALVATMLLAGVAVSALTLACTGAFVFASDDRQMRDITFWTMGSVSAATWSRIGAILPFVLAQLIALPFLVRGLNALILGEREAGHLGLPVEFLKKAAVTLVALAVGAAVSVSGTIGFVGMMVPHLVRLSLGSDHRIVLPGAALLGATLLVLADVLARIVVAPAELPIGLVTALVGGPFFLGLLLRERNRIDGA